MSFQPMSMTEKQAPEMLSQQDDQNVLPVQFTKVEGYTTFHAEFGVDGDDLVFHFFLPRERVHQPTVNQPTGFSPQVAARIENYWKDGFPRTLDVVARDFFKAEFPRLKAAYTQELQSWWLRGFGFAAVLDADARARMFLERLDQALDALKVNVRVA